MQNFFMHGSVPQDIGGWAPVYWWTDNVTRDNVAFDRTLADDYALIKKELHASVFRYAPPLWRLGLTEQYFDLERENPERALQTIIKAGSQKQLPERTIIYRIRLNHNAPSMKCSFDTPPPESKSEYGRFDSRDLPVFYGAFDVETCLHECRVTLIDEVVLATFVSEKCLRVLDLYDFPNTGTTIDPFNSVDILITKLCHSGPHEYDKCRLLARAVAQAAFDGMIVPSYFSQVKDKSLPNLLLFGFPETDKKISLQSLNRVKLDRVQYEFTLGPVFDSH
jgi:hypothetical protein